MGWLGWTEQETLDTSIPAIEIAYEGRLEMLRVMHFGGASNSVPDIESSPVEPMSGKTAMAIIRSAGKPRP